MVIQMKESLNCSSMRKKQIPSSLYFSSSFSNRPLDHASAYNGQNFFTDDFTNDQNTGYPWLMEEICESRHQHYLEICGGQRYNASFSLDQSYATWFF
jgi:hypothetical protein